MAKPNKPRSIPFREVLQEELKNPKFAEAFEARRLIHELAKTVRGMRETAGLTQAELAHRIGSSQPTIARLETGLDQRTPRWDLLYRIGKALGKQLKITFTDEPGALVSVEKSTPRKPRRAGKQGEAART